MICQNCQKDFEPKPVQADCVFCDPPYNVAYKSRGGGLSGSGQRVDQKRRHDGAGILWFYIRRFWLYIYRGKTRRVFLHLLRLVKLSAIRIQHVAIRVRTFRRDNLVKKRGQHGLE